MTEQASELLRRARAAYKDQRYADAKADLTAMADSCRETAPPHWPEGLALRWLGETERRLNNHHAAHEFYEQAAAKMRIDADQPMLAHTIRHLGLVYEELDMGDRARPFYEEALSIYRNAANPSPGDLANAIRYLAVNLHDGGDTGAARPLWEEARGLYQSLGVQAGVDECSTRLGQC